jgi:hypothetical protein
VAKLRCVFYDPNAVDADSRLGERALEACARAGVEVFALALDGEVEFEGEPRAVDFVMRAHGYTAEECIGVGPALAGAPLGAVWVDAATLDVRGAHIRAAEDAESDLLYEAVITELAQRR